MEEINQGVIEIALLIKIEDLGFLYKFNWKYKKWEKLFRSSKRNYSKKHK